MQRDLKFQMHLTANKGFVGGERGRILKGWGKSSMMYGHIASNVEQNMVIYSKNYCEEISS